MSKPSVQPQDPGRSSDLDRQLRDMAAAAVAERGARVAADPWRQAFHVQPRVGALSDPVGLVEQAGVYHLCHLWHPFVPDKPVIFWVHCTSTDLVHWTEPKIVLAPSDYYDSHGCYSGSAILHDGQVRLLYTGNVRTPDGGRIPYQCLATVHDDGTATKHPANPLLGPIPGYTPHLRDPQAWAADGGYLMVLGAQTEDLHGALPLFRSVDLLQWELVGQVAGGAAEPFGYMWECPGMLRMLDRAAEAAGRDDPGRDVLIVSPQLDHGSEAGPARFEDTSCFTIGQLNLDPPRFEHGPFHRLDAGPDFYAPRTMVDQRGRAILIGWMGMPVHEGEPALGDRHPTLANGWVHCLTVPRTLELVDGRLIQWPVAELDQLHGDPVRFGDVDLRAGEPVTLPGVAGRALDLHLCGRAGPAAALEVRLREGPGQATVLVVEPGSGSVRLDRTASGAGEGGVWSGVLDPSGTFELRLLLDHSSVEAFVAGGRLVLSARLYPEEGSTGISFTAVGGAVELADVTCYPMASV